MCRDDVWDYLGYVGNIENIPWYHTESHFFLIPNPMSESNFFFGMTNLWAALCLSSNLDSLFATPDNCGGTFLQSQPFAGMGQTF